MEVNQITTLLKMTGLWNLRLVMGSERRPANLPSHQDVSEALPRIDCGIT